MVGFWKAVVPFGLVLLRVSLALSLKRRHMNTASQRDIMIILAPPAGGKGTQAKMIAAERGIAHLSTGDMLRAEVASKSEVGLAAKAIMAQGGLVSDELVIKIVELRIQKPDCEHGFILDGFPRTVAQADALDRMLAESGEKVTRIINLEVPDDAVVQRITGRWIHKASGRSYHVLWNPPKSLGSKEPSAATMLDDITGEALIQRKDDTQEAAFRRLEKYYSETEPILAHYDAKSSAQGIIAIVDGDQGIDEVKAAVSRALAKQPPQVTKPSKPQNSCEEAVVGAKKRVSAWLHPWVSCKCPAGSRLTGENHLCKAASHDGRHFNPKELAGMSCKCV